ncbi:MAG: sigma-54-dependent transcriptional regulator [Sphingobacteriaceae bacterium]
MNTNAKNSALKIFLLEDDKWYNKFLSHHISLNPDNIVESFFTASELLKSLYKNPSLVILDYSLPDDNGENVLKKIKEFNPSLDVIMVSGQEDIATAVQLLKQGASDYIIKNEETKERLWASISNIRDKISLKEEIVELKNELKTHYDFSDSMIGNSQAMKSTYSIIEKACNSNINVSINGETGTGKEVVAKTIHYNSNRKKGKFIAVNVASIPKDLIESELFGHEKGSFTGALARRIGKFEEANNGTLFLDEIAEMDMNMQVKLLRVLQERELNRVGGNDLVKFDIRLIVATHKDLAAEVQNGNFREDLYYRIMGLTINLPPLRERGSDIILLAKHFIKSYCKDNKINLLKLNNDAQNKLMDYHYPGNIRELKSIIDLACVMCDEPEIKPEHIKFVKKINNQDMLLKEMSLDDYIFQIIRSYLDKYDNNVLLVAKKLNIGKSTIYRMIKEKQG